MYEGIWYDGIVLEVNQELNDIYVKCMHPSGPARSFTWPNVDDCTRIPMIHVLCTIGVPGTANERHYSLEEKDVSNSATRFATFTDYVFKSFFDTFPC